MLKEYILQDMNNFLKELGNGFAYIDNEYKIKIGDKYNYIDLLLYNYLYNAFVVVELKVTESNKNHLGQIMVYMNYIDKYVKGINNDKTIGIIVCRKDNRFLIEYSTDSRIKITTYELV
jgi:RecB family endonuclease NucS